MKPASLLAALILAAGATFIPSARAEDAAPALNFKMKDIDGNDVDLSKFKGKVLLMVNVASYCGNTLQYTALEADYQKYKSKGFTILAFPANNFKNQEPGTDADIKKFCTAEDSKYHITFPLFSKISVKGEDQAPLYKYLTSLDTKPVGKGDITWNFEKFVVGRDGTVVARFTPKTKPDDPAVVKAIEEALAK